MALSKRSLALALVALIATPTWADTLRASRLLREAEGHEKNYQWDKAFAAYEQALKVSRNLPGAKERQLHALRRYWQEQRHADIGYRKEVLGLDYGQALQVYGHVFDALLDTPLRGAERAVPSVVCRGLEELETALADPGFLASHLRDVRPAKIQTFRNYLARKRSETATLDRAGALRFVREVALAGQSSLRLSPTTALLEMACGGCYAIDDYTAYLTPAQFRELADSFKAPMGFMTSVQFGMKTDAVGYLRIAAFQEATPQEVDAAFLELRRSGMKGLLLDLRGNPGGLIEAAIDTARRFLPRGVIASMENYDPKLSLTYQASNPDAWTIPVVVLVDADTASAAEVLAGALKDNARARVVGQGTFGKGIAQGLVKLPDALGGLPTGGLRLTIARFLSPKGSPYQGQGVQPDVVVDQTMMSADAMDDDRALVAALAELERLRSLRR